MTGPADSISVVIATHNRAHILSRALASVINAGGDQVEIIVVDDCSSDETLRYRDDSRIRYFRQPENRGPGAARNRGLRAASGDWVIILDDDDTLLPAAFQTLTQALAGLPDANSWPVLQFASTNATGRQPFRIARVPDYLGGRIRGDHTIVVRRALFLERRLAYPELPTDGAGQLWLRIAAEDGIPTWPDPIVRIHSDAPDKMCSIAWQLRHARVHAELQEAAIRDFGRYMTGEFRSCRREKLLGAATYWLLAGDRNRSRRRSLEALVRHRSATAIGLLALSILPAAAVQGAFQAYRKRGGL